MKDNDKLGMSQNISRRQFINGAACSLGATALNYANPVFALSNSAAEAGYPPELTGLRGSHPGSFEVAHSIAREGKRWPIPQTASERYDLVVVGGGVSGLAAARFYQLENPSARILILENHDDFGGHAKRNEFDVDGKLLIGYGGSQTMENPNSYPPAAKALLADLGIDLKRFETAFDRSVYNKQNMETGMFFKNIGGKKNVQVDFSVGDIAGEGLTAPTREQMDQLPLSKADKDKFYELWAEPKDYFAHVPKEEQAELIWSLSYKAYLRDYCGASEELLRVFQQVTDGTYGESFDLVSAAAAWGYAGHPGFGGLNISKDVLGRDPSEPYIHHFPDGNAGVARLLVRKMNPAVAPGNNMEDIVLAKFDYNKLDRPNQRVNVRLNSTVINVVSGNDNKPAQITYVKNGQSQRVDAKHCVLACYNGIIPHIMPELEQDQANALRKHVKTPLTYTNVALRNWRAFQKAGLKEYYCADSFFSNVALDFPVSMGGYEFAKTPDDPILVHMEFCPTNYGSELDMISRYRLGRHQLLSMSFEDFELKIRQQLSDMLSPYGFDAARDIAGITVNRWPHGYAFWDDSGFNIVGRKKVGNVTIANSDAGARAMLQAAIQQAYRAVQELS